MRETLFSKLERAPGHENGQVVLVREIACTVTRIHFFWTSGRTEMIESTI